MPFKSLPILVSIVMLLRYAERHTSPTYFIHLTQL